MRTRTLRIALLGTITAAVALTQQACANGTAVQPAAAPPASASQAAEDARTASPAATKTAGKGGSKSDGKGAGKDSSDEEPVDDVVVEDCQAKDIEASISLQEPEGKVLRGMIMLTNTSDLECGIGGHATYFLTNAAGEVVDVPTRKVDEPGRSGGMTVLKVGSSLWQGIKWTTCDKGDVTCGVGNDIVFKLQASDKAQPAELEGFPAPEKSNITMKSLQIGTIQPSRQGVVAW